MTEHLARSTPPGSTAALAGTVRRLCRIAAPLVAYGVITVVVAANDVILVGRSGDQAVNAAAASTALLMVGVMFFAGLAGVPTQILVSRAWGAGNHDGARQAAERVLLVVAALSITAAIMLGAFAPVLMRLIGGDVVDVDLAVTMLRVVLLALPVTATTGVVRGFASGIGETRIVMYASVASGAADVVVSLTLLELGTGPVGVAIGTVAGYGAAAIVSWSWVARRRRAGKVVPSPAASLRVPDAEHRAVWRLGWPEALLGGTAAGAGVVVTLLLSASDPSALAATRSLEAMTGVMWVVGSSIGSAGLTLLGQAVGADDRVAYRQALRATLFVGMGVAGVVMAVMIPVTVPILELTMGASIAAAAAPVIWLAWSQAIWVAVDYTALGVCRSFADTRTPMIASVVSEYAVFLPVGWILCWEHGLGIEGLFITHHIYWVAFVAIVGSVAVRRLRSPWPRPADVTA